MNDDSTPVYLDSAWQEYVCNWSYTLFQEWGVTPCMTSISLICRGKQKLPYQKFRVFEDLLLYVI
jgi:hypothetical protein